MSALPTPTPKPLPTLGAVTVSWDPNSEADLSRYKIYYGLAADSSFGNVLDVGNITSFRLGGLVWGVTYRFAITALDFSNNESGFSEAVIYVMIDNRPPPRWSVVFFDTMKTEEPDVMPDNWGDRATVNLLLDGKKVDWGEWNSDHTYSIQFTGTGGAVTFQIQDSYYEDNSGELQIEIDNDSFSVSAKGQVVNASAIRINKVVTIKVTGIFNYWEPNIWAISDANFQQNSVVAKTIPETTELEK